MREKEILVEKIKNFFSEWGEEGSGNWYSITGDEICVDGDFSVAALAAYILKEPNV